MDFTLDEETRAVRDLAAQILADHGDGAQRDGSGRYGAPLATALGQAGLLALHLPTEYGGSGLGIGAAMTLLEEQGRVTAAAPLWPVVVAAHAVAVHAPKERREALLAPVVAGEAALTVALEEYGPVSPWSPTTTAVQKDEAWILSGTKAAVPVVSAGGSVVVSAATGDGPALFLIDAAAAGATWTATTTTDTSATANLLLDETPALRLGGDEAVRDVVELAVVAVAATQLGVMQGALRLAASYLSEREQFGRPLATFQAVQHKLADCYIDIDCSRVTLWQAISDVAEAAPDRSRSVPVAQWWAARAGLDVVHRTQHLHGGTGVDQDFPAHRFYLWARQLAGTFGSDRDVLARLGDDIAATSATAAATAQRAAS